MNSQEYMVKRPRGRPPRRKSPPEPIPQAPADHYAHSPQESTASREEPHDSSLVGELSTFAAVLRQILKRDRETMTRVAQKLEVTEQTIYRWMRGSTEPRPIYLQQLLALFPEHQQQLSWAIQQTFPGLLGTSSSAVQPVQKDLYRRILDLSTTMVEDDVRCWHIAQTIFDYALLHLDREQRGLVLTFAQLMPERDDGIHSLYESMRYGSAPWSPRPEHHVYLGSTTLAGVAAMSQRTETWNELDPEGHAQVDIDVHERSACAHPVIRAGRLAGVLVVSSTQPGFFDNPVACESVVEYAQLLSLAFRDEELKPLSALHLRPMPAVTWQRTEISRQYIPRVVACARQYGLTRRQAETRVRAEMEMEFEELARASGRWPETQG